MRSTAGGSWVSRLVRRDRLAAIALLCALPVQPQEAPVDEFRQTAIPEGIPARFTCHQAGTEIVALDDVASFAPARIQGVMTFSVAARNRETRLLYLGDGTTCGLTVTGG